MRFFFLAVVAALSIIATPASAQEDGIIRLGDLPPVEVQATPAPAPSVQYTAPTAVPSQPIVMSQQGPCTFSGISGGQPIVTGACSDAQRANIAAMVAEANRRNDRVDQALRYERERVDIATDAYRKDVVTDIFAGLAANLVTAGTCAISDRACGYSSYGRGRGRSYGGGMVRYPGDY